MDDLFKLRTLLPHMKRLPAKRVVHLPNFTADPFSVSLQFNASDAHPLPPSIHSENYAVFEVSGNKDAVAK